MPNSPFSPQREQARLWQLHARNCGDGCPQCFSMSLSPPPFCFSMSLIWFHSQLYKHMMIPNTLTLEWAYCTRASWNKECPWLRWWPSSLIPVMREGTVLLGAAAHWCNWSSSEFLRSDVVVPARWQCALRGEGNQAHWSDVWFRVFKTTNRHFFFIVSVKCLRFLLTDM